MDRWTQMKLSKAHPLLFTSLKAGGHLFIEISGRRPVWLSRFDTTTPHFNY